MHKKVIYKNLHEMIFLVIYPYYAGLQVSDTFSFNKYMG